MTEASVTQDLLKHLKANLPGAVVLKICDRFTKGIPDVVVTWRGYTTWLEIKLLKRGESLARCSDEMQQFMVTRLRGQSYGRAWYVVYDARAAKTTSIYEPGALKSPNPDAYLTAHAEGFAHRLVTDLLEQTHDEEFRAAA